VAVDQLGAGARGPGVGACLRLGEPERGERAPGDQVGQPALALRRAAVGEDRVDAEADACGQRDARGLVDVAELLDGHAQAGEVAARAAVLLGHDQAEQAQLAHLGDEVRREVVGLVPLRDVRRDLGRCEVPDDCSEILVVIFQRERHRLAPPDRPRGGGRPRAGYRRAAPTGGAGHPAWLAWGP
jgi:hypothetical protein